MKNKIKQIMILSLAAIGLVACGGGGSEGTQPVVPDINIPFSTKMVPVSQVGITDILVLSQVCHEINW